jgi:phenylalanine ammonia-lyase
MLETPLEIHGSGLRISGLVDVARKLRPVRLTDAPERLEAINRSRTTIDKALAQGQRIYGVNSGFGGMGQIKVSEQDTPQLQANLLWFLKAGSGRRLPEAEVRATMLLRANSLARGVSGIRVELIERLLLFLNERVSPHVQELGSIGASGDLVPLAAIAGALVGTDASFLVDYRGQSMPCTAALKSLGLAPLELQPKEGLALVNGTSALSGIAAGCVHDAQQMLALTMAVHALAIQALNGSDQPFDPFIHRHKPHPGQILAATCMSDLLRGSQQLREATLRGNPEVESKLIQDRYSVRCLPQFLGPILDGLTLISGQVETEMNSANDNPLIDSQTGTCYHGGNFLGQYVGVGMDQLRYHLALAAKHLDAQLALLMEPVFSGGLPSSLVGNESVRVNMGVKGLQIGANSVMPLMMHQANGLVPHFPTHAEQFNQNVNSQGFGSANLTRGSLELYRHYLAYALLIAVQAVSLRTQLLAGHGDARVHLAPATLPLYEAIRTLVGQAADMRRPLIYNDNEQALDRWLAILHDEIAAGGRIIDAVKPVLERLAKHQFHSAVHEFDTIESQDNSCGSQGRTCFEAPEVHEHSS